MDCLYPSERRLAFQESCLAEFFSREMKERLRENPDLTERCQRKLEGKAWSFVAVGLYVSNPQPSASNCPIIDLTPNQPFLSAQSG